MTTKGFKKGTTAQCQWERETWTRAQGMVTSLQKFVNIVEFVILKHSHDYIKGLAARLQKREKEVMRLTTLWTK